uniref:RRM domain-containing protein n=1 Tax=Megaselia scalaris TaxID=36166 RepID=T1GPT1_MEGSC
MVFCTILLDSLRTHNGNEQKEQHSFASEMNHYLYDIFGKFGAIRQLRTGNTPQIRGTAFVVYEDIFDVKNVCDHFSGFNIVPISGSRFFATKESNRLTRILRRRSQVWRSSVPPINC